MFLNGDGGGGGKNILCLPFKKKLNCKNWNGSEHVNIVTRQLHSVFVYDMTFFLTIIHPSLLVGNNIFSGDLLIYRESKKIKIKKNRTHSFGDTAILCTISVTAGF